MSLNPNAKEWKPKYAAVEDPVPPPPAVQKPKAVPEVKANKNQQGKGKKADPKSKKQQALTPEAETELIVDLGGAIDGIDLSEDVFDQSKSFSSKDHFNVVFIGHVDAGKSTLCGNILLLMGQVDSHTMEKYIQEAKSLNRESWFLAYIMDTNEEEKAKGKTVEVGRAYFETEKKRFTLLDCPGHKNYVPNMIAGASQADLGVLVISARKGEFEAGFDRSGQTSEHAILIRTLGVDHLIVVVNKMDEETVLWNQERFDQIRNKLSEFLKTLGFKKVTFIPISAKSGDNIKTKSSNVLSEWYSGPCLMDYLDSVESTYRDVTGPFRFPILESYSESGLWVGGKIESGFLTESKKIVSMPGRQVLDVLEIQINDKPVSQASVGENVMIKLKGGSDSSIKKGMVLSCAKSLCPVVFKFIAHLRILEIPNIIAGGHPAVCHIHTTSEDCIITEILESTDLRTKKTTKNAQFTKSNSKILCKIELARSVALECFDKVPSLSRISLREEGTTVAIGFIKELVY